MMRIHRIIPSFIAVLSVSCAGLALAQQTVTDQYGTEILTDVLPPAVQSQVYETQTVLDTGGGEGPLKVDTLGRFHLDEGAGKGGMGGGPSQEEYLHR